MTLNLDQFAAKRAQEMVRNAAGVPGISRPVETLERLATKTLGVLQEQGVYAALLFLFSRTADEKSIAPVIRVQLYQALAELPAFSANTALQSTLEADRPQAVLAQYADTVLDDLDTLLLVRDLYEQTLIYARYGAKAAGG